MCLGSCFAEEIENKLDGHLFTSRANPLGTIYSPIGVAGFLTKVASSAQFAAGDFFKSEDLWKHFAIQGNLAQPTLEQSVATANLALDEARQFFTSSSWLILTLGTAWCYRHKGSDSIVTHNHKMPSSDFERRLLNVDEVVEALKKPLQVYLNQPQRPQVLITVSPVRHTRDGLHENNLSKSTLLLACDELGKSTSGVTYFPSYEIIIDELRDYRFFRDDLIHPSSFAISYVWEKICECFMTEKTIEILHEITEIKKTLEHRPRFPQSDANRSLHQKLQNMLLSLNHRGVDTSRLEVQLKGLVEHTR